MLKRGAEGGPVAPVLYALFLLHRAGKSQERHSKTAAVHIDHEAAELTDDPCVVGVLLENVFQDIERLAFFAGLVVLDRRIEVLSEIHKSPSKKMGESCPSPIAVTPSSTRDRRGCSANPTRRSCSAESASAGRSSDRQRSSRRSQPEHPSGSPDEWSRRPCTARRSE